MCGVAYTTLAWYLGVRHPNRHQRTNVSQKCMTRAVEMVGGDSKTLEALRFAKAPPGLGRELLPGRSVLPRQWVESACASARSVTTHGKEGSDSVKLRRCNEGARRGKRKGILWRLSDLEAVLGK